jgi:V8-like Glu-specific endopeptidase
MITITHLSGFGRGKSKTFQGPSILLGTDPSCDIRFDATWDKEVSPRHAQISILNGECVIDDLGSATGVWIGGRKITREVLHGTVEVTLGQNGQRLQVQVANLPASAPVQQAAAPAHTLPQRRPAPASGSSKAVPIAIGIAALLGFGFFGAKQAGLLDSGDNRPPRRASVMQGTEPSGQDADSAAATVPSRMLDSDERLRLAAKKYEQAVGVVIFSANGKGEPGGTAWAVAEKTFATNSHITEMVSPLLEDGGAVHVVLNKNPNLRYRVLKAISHPEFLTNEKLEAGQLPRLNIDGKPESVGAYDVGLLVVDEDPPVKMPLASEAKLQQLDSGHRVAFLGFPLEGLKSDNIDMHYPVATMQSGIITSMTDSWMAQSTHQKSVLIHHNLPSAGGASGSPVFDADGSVVGLHCAGNYTMGIRFDVGNMLKAEAAEQIKALRAKALAMLRNPRLSEKEKDEIKAAFVREASAISAIPAEALTRVTSASLINFAQRVDLLKGLMKSNGISYTESN